MLTGPLGKLGRGSKVGGLCSMQRNSLRVWHRIREDANKKEEVTVSTCYKAGLRRWSGWDLLQTTSLSYVSAPADLSIQKYISQGLEFWNRYLCEGWEKKQTKADQSNSQTPPPLPSNQPTNQVLMPEFGIQFWYKKQLFNRFITQGDAPCTFWRIEKKVFKENICSNLHLCLLFCPQEDSFAL